MFNMVGFEFFPLLKTVIYFGWKKSYFSLTVAKLTLNGVAKERKNERKEKKEKNPKLYGILLLKEK